MHYNGAKTQNCIIQKICTTGGQSLMSLPGTSKKNFSFHFKRYNLTIRAVNFLETFCTCCPSSLGQDPTTKIPKNDLFFVVASWARNGRFEHFFEKNELRPLGVKYALLTEMVFHMMFSNIA
jgi:hypothetical protein